MNAAGKRIGKRNCLLLKAAVIVIMMMFLSALCSGRAEAGWVKAPDGKTYYCGKSGKAVTGWLKLGNKTYYLDPADKGARVTGFRMIGNKPYYFWKSDAGSLARGKISWLNAKTAYYSGKDGVLRKGVIRLGSRTYFFSLSSYKMMFGWVKVGSTTYYLRSTGSYVNVRGTAVTGWMKKDGKLYYFDKNGKMQTGLKTIGSRQYYFDPETGASVVGTVKVGRTKYTFGTNGRAVSASGPWNIRVNRSTCTVTVYRGSTPVKAFACSVGLYGSTPTGTFTIRDHLRWHELNGPSWGQWCCHITYNILFHSIPYSSYRNKYSLPASAYNKLGRPASHGCIRLAAANAKYIYDHVPVGSKVVIFDGSSKNDPLGKPMPPYVGHWWKNYDPTDPTI